jgi:hypothetical protein
MSIEFEGLGSASQNTSADDDTREVPLPAPTISFQNGTREFSIPLEALPRGDHYLFGRFGKRDVAEDGLHLVSLPHVAPEGWDADTVSRSHFEIWRNHSTGRYVIKDLDSKNGILAQIKDPSNNTKEFGPLEQGQTYELHNMSTLKLPGFGKITFRLPAESPISDDER